MDTNSVARAVVTTLDPHASNYERTKCIQMVEEYKTSVFQLGDLTTLCGPSQNPSVVLFGLKCLEHKIKHSWNRLDIDTKRSIKQSLFSLAEGIDTMITSTDEGKVICLALTHIFVHLIKREWPQNWPTMMDEFLNFGRKGNIQASLTLNTFLRLYEDTVQFPDIPQPRRRDIISTLNDNLIHLLSFSFEILLQSKIQSPMTKEAVGLSRESMKMLIGYFDSCRMDVLLYWKPSSVNGHSMTSEIPFIELLCDLLWVDGTRQEALELLLLILKRRQSQNADDPVAKLAFCFLDNPLALNRILSILCTTLNEGFEFSEKRYNTLLLTSEIVARLGCFLVQRWTDWGLSLLPCGCADQPQLACPNRTSHVINCIHRATVHPIRMISAATSIFWLTAFQSGERLLLSNLQAYLPSLFMVWRMSLRKDGQPDGNGPHSEWARGVFDSEEYTGFASRYRQEVIRCLTLVASLWPADLLQLIMAFGYELLKTPLKEEDMNKDGEFSCQSSPLLQDWDALILLLNNLLVPLRNGMVASNEFTQFDHVIYSLTRQIVHLTPSNDLNLRGKHLTCASILMQHVDARHDSELMVPFLTQLFACFRFNPFPLKSDHASGARRHVCLRNMHRDAASAFFHLTRASPQRIMTHFDAVGSEVVSLWGDSNSGAVEKCVLLEALIVLCLQLPQPIHIQRDYIKQLVSHITLAWSTTDQPADEPPTPMSRFLRSCAESGGSGLVNLLGLDQPLSVHDDKNSPFVVLRIGICQNILALLAVSRRLSEPTNAAQLEHITLPFLEPIFANVLIVLRAFNELFTPTVQARVHPTIIPAFELTEQTKFNHLSLQIGRSNKHPPHETKTAIDHIRVFLHDYHENIMQITGSLFSGLGSKLFQLSTEQLAVVLHYRCCTAFEHLPDFKLNRLLRLVIQQYIRCCPKVYFPTAIVPLLPPIIDGTVQRLDSRWNQVTLMSQVDAADDKAVTEELVGERLTRLLGRTWMDLMRIIYTFNGSESISPSSTVDEDDVDMNTVETRSLSSAGGGTGGGNGGASVVEGYTTGALAHAFIAAAAPVDSGGPYSDPLFLLGLSKSMGWPDSMLCMKASQWIPSLIETLTQFSLATDMNGAPRSKRPLSGPLAEVVLFGILCGLHVNGKNAETNLTSLLTAAIRVYSAVDVTVACDQLRSVLAKVLLNASDPDQSMQVMQSIQTFESKFLDKQKSVAEKAKRDMLKKLLQPIIGIPLCQQFRDNVTITSLAPISRSKWKPHAARNGDSFPDTFGLSALFSN